MIPTFRLVGTCESILELNNMINLNFSISNPWYKYQQQSAYFNKAWHVFKNKAFEVQAQNGTDELLGFSLNWSLRTDHAGVRITLYFFHRFVHVNLYDMRHWDYDKGGYIEYANSKFGE